MTTNTSNIWTNEKDGILTVQELAFNILTDMTAPTSPGIAGFTIKAGISNGSDVSLLPATYTNVGGTALFLPAIGTDPTVAAGYAEFVLEPTTQVDMLAAAQGSIAKQLYRIYMRVSVDFINIVLGTDTQITVIPTGTASTISVTATTATTNLITAAGHNLSKDQQITFGTTAGGLTQGTTYYVISTGLTANAFSVSTTLGGTAVVLTTTTTANTGTITSTSPSISVAKDQTSTQKAFYPGLVGVSGANLNPVSTVDEYFVDRYDVNSAGTSNIAGVESSHPMSYRISYAQNASTTFGANGFALCVWEPGNDAGNDSSNIFGCKHSWLVVQRSVDNTTGQVATTSTPPLTVAGLTGKLPVFCFYRIYRPQDTFYTDATGKLPVCVLNKFIVRESDITRQSTTADASLSSADNFANVPNCGSINLTATPVYQQSSSIVSLLEDGSYNVNLVSGLNTSRFSYPKNELDLIGFTSADVVSTGQTISFTAYGETSARQYFTLVSTGANNTGIRFFIRVA